MEYPPPIRCTLSLAAFGSCQPRHHNKHHNKDTIINTIIKISGDVFLMVDLLESAVVIHVERFYQVSVHFSSHFKMCKKGGWEIMYIFNIFGSLTSTWFLNKARHKQSNAYYQGYFLNKLPNESDILTQSLNAMKYSDNAV